MDTKERRESSPASTANNLLLPFLRWVNIYYLSLCELYTYVTIRHTFPSKSSTQPSGKKLANDRCDRENYSEKRPNCILKIIKSLRNLFTKLSYENIIGHDDSESLSKRLIDKWFNVNIGRIQRWSDVSFKGFLWQPLTIIINAFNYTPLYLAGIHRRRTMRLIAEKYKGMDESLHTRTAVFIQTSERMTLLLPIYIKLVGATER